MTERERDRSFDLDFLVVRAGEGEVQGEDVRTGASGTAKRTVGEVGLGGVGVAGGVRV